MIQGLVVLLLFQGLGELLVKALALPIPGPVMGLVALLVFFIWRRRISNEVESVANAMTQHLGLLFIPASVGVVKFFPQLQSWGVPLAIALVLSVALSIGLVAWVLKRLAKPSDPSQKARS